MSSHTHTHTHSLSLSLIYIATTTETGAGCAINLISGHSVLRSKQDEIWHISTHMKCDCTVNCKHCWSRNLWFTKPFSVSKLKRVKHWPVSYSINKMFKFPFLLCTCLLLHISMVGSVREIWVKDVHQWMHKSTSYHSLWVLIKLLVLFISISLQSTLFFLIYHRQHSSVDCWPLSRKSFDSTKKMTI